MAARLGCRRSDVIRGALELLLDPAALGSLVAEVLAEAEVLPVALRPGGGPSGSHGRPDPPKPIEGLTGRAQWTSRPIRDLLAPEHEEGCTTGGRGHTVTLRPIVVYRCTECSGPLEDLALKSDQDRDIFEFTGRCHHCGVRRLIPLGETSQPK